MSEPPVDLCPDCWVQVQTILRQYLPEFEVRAFGSRVSGRAKKYSDLDLVVMTDVPLSRARLADLREAFSESDLPIKVDVVDWAVTQESFRKIIEHQYVVIQPQTRKVSSSSVHP